MVDYVENFPETIETCSKLQRELADKITQHAPLHEIRILLATGAKINDPIMQGLRPLHYAVYGNNVEVVKMLLARGSDINATDDVGYSATHLSAEHGNLEMLQFLVDNGAQASFVDKNDEDPYPVGLKCEEPLRMAVKNDHYACAELLLQNGADPNARYFLGNELTLISVTEIEYLDLLLKYGGNPNCYTRDGLTPLMKACKHPLGLTAALTLLQHGADVNAMALERQDFRMPLHYAILSGNLDIVKVLVEKGAMINMPETYDKPTPLDVAVVRDNIEIIDYLLENGASPTACHTYIGTPLHLACCSVLNNQYEIIRRLLKAGADPNSCPVFDAGPIRSPFTEYFRAGRPYFDPKVVQLLLAHGAEVVMQGPLKDPKGILRAITRLKEKDYQIWCMLLDAGVNYDQRYIDRLSIPQKFKEELTQAAWSPRSLKQQARDVIRCRFHQLGYSKVILFEIPKILQNYLVFNLQ